MGSFRLHLLSHGIIRIRNLVRRAQIKANTIEKRSIWSPIADDFIVTATSKEILQNKVMPTLVDALAKVGLELSSTKTKITHINDGFDFLGSNVRKYKDEKLLIKPAKTNIKLFLQEIRTTIKKGIALPTEKLIHTLNSRLTGWVNYYRTSVSSKNETQKEYGNAIGKFLFYVATGRVILHTPPYEESLIYSKIS